MNQSTMNNMNQSTNLKNSSDENIISFDELLSVFKEEGILKNRYIPSYWTEEGLRTLYNGILSLGTKFFIRRYLGVQNAYVHKPPIDQPVRGIEGFTSIYICRDFEDVMNAYSFCKYNVSNECYLAYAYAVYKATNKDQKLRTFNDFLNADYADLNAEGNDGIIFNAFKKLYLKPPERYCGPINDSCISFLKSKGLIVLPYGSDIGKKDARPENLGTVIEMKHGIYPDYKSFKYD